MNDRTNRATLGLAALVLGSVFSHAALAKGPRSLAIPACAKMSTLESTIDPSKPDAERKRQQVAKLRRQCEAAMKASPPAPPPPARRAPLRPAPAPKQPPGPNPFEQMQRIREQQREQQRLQHEQQRALGAQQRAQREQQQQQQREQQQQEREQQRALRAQRRAQRRAAAGAVFVPAPVAAPAPAAANPAPVVAPATFAPVAAPAPAPPAPSNVEQRNVFGIQLNEPFSVPPCAPGVIVVRDPHGFDSTAKTQKLAVAANCSDSSAAVQPLAQRMADVAGKPLPAGVKLALVRISPEHCPSWVSGSCTVSVALKANMVLGVAFLTAEDSERMIVKVIGSKYNGRPESREPAACDNEAGADPARRQGTDSRWSLADLQVSYWAVGGLNCGQGRVLVQTDAMQQLFRLAMSGDDQPKM